MSSVFHQFVEDVLSFSSQYGSAGSISYTAHNIIGKPRIYPHYGDFPQAFIMRSYGNWAHRGYPSITTEIRPQDFGNIRSQDFIVLKFERKVFATGVHIYETYNPGAIVKIFAGDSLGNWRLLWEGLPQRVQHKPRIFSPKITAPSFETNLLRLEFDHRHLEYYTELDAVMMTGTCDPPVQVGGELTRKVLQLNLHLPAIPSTELQSKTESSFERLPVELILQILSWLDLRSICRCAAVSHKFRIAASDSSLYTRINLKAYWWLVGAPCLQSLTSRCRPRLTELQLSWCAQHSLLNPFIRFINECGSTLKILRLDHCRFVNSDCLQSISNSCSKLRELSMSGVVVSEGWGSLGSLTQLQRLQLYASPVRESELLVLLPRLPALLHLGLGGSSLGVGLDRVVSCVAASCPRLLSLDLWKAHSLSSAGLRCLAQLRNLQDLDLGWSNDTDSPGDGLRLLLLSCSALRRLVLSAMRGAAERDLMLLAARCHHLEVLDLLGVCAVSPELCLRVLGQCTQLRLLDVSYCELVSETHVRQWRALFPHVLIQRSTPPPDSSD